MKSAVAVAATALLGTASAAVHSMKLKKVPLAEQLVRHFHLTTILLLKRSERGLC